MHAHRRRARLALTVLAVVPVLAAAPWAVPAGAQTQWLDRDARSSVRFDALFVSLRDQDTRIPTGVVVATARLPVGDHAWFVGELPYAHRQEPRFTPYLTEAYTYGEDFAHSEGTIGNPYFGLEFARHANGMHYEAGFRPSLTASGQLRARTVGFGSSIEHESAFLERVVSARIAADYHHAASARRPIGYDVRIAPLFQVDSGPHDFVIEPQGVAFHEDAFDQLGQRPELFLDYDANLRLEAQNARLMLGYAARWIASRPHRTFAENSMHELTFGLQFDRGTVHPGFQVIVPIARDEASFRQATGVFTLTSGLPSRVRPAGWALAAAP
jgi:hypothetical protein